MSFGEVLSSLLNGFGNTLLLFFITLVCALPLGLLISFGSMTRFRPVRYVVRVFIWIIRGTPLMLQVIIVFYVPGIVFQTPMQSRLFAVSIAFVINYACYFSEIYRGGIQSVSVGQYEAAQVLGLTKAQTFGKIVLPQVVKRIVPPMSNEIITLVKDTSLARVISFGEIIMSGENFLAQYGIIWPLLATGIFYLLFNGILTLLFGYAERKMSYYR